jgi:hypothetical protein
VALLEVLDLVVAEVALLEVLDLVVAEAEVVA